MKIKTSLAAVLTMNGFGLAPSRYKMHGPRWCSNGSDRMQNITAFMWIILVCQVHKQCGRREKGGTCRVQSALQVKRGRLIFVHSLFQFTSIVFPFKVYWNRRLCRNHENSLSLVVLLKQLASLSRQKDDCQLRALHVASFVSVSKGPYYCDIHRHKSESHNCPKK